MTTTWSRTVCSVGIVMVPRSPPTLTVFSTVSKPTEMNWRTEPAGTVREKTPSRSAVVPVVVPFTTTPAPRMGSPFSSTTVPLTVTSFWARAA